MVNMELASENKILMMSTLWIVAIRSGAGPLHYNIFKNAMDADTIVFNKKNTAREMNMFVSLQLQFTHCYQTYIPTLNSNM